MTIGLTDQGYVLDMGGGRGPLTWSRTLTISLPTRIADLIGGQLITVVNSTITLGFTPSALVPLPGTVGNTNYYVDVNAPNDTADGLTPATPKGFIYSAITLGNTAAVPYTINIVPGVYPRGRNHHNGTTAVVPTQPCRFTSTGVVTIVGGTNGTWTLDTGTTWRRTLTGTAECIDIVNNDADGDPIRFTKAVDLATCRATPGTWFDNGTNTYVNRTAGDAVTNTNTAVLVQSTAGGLKNSTNGNTWFENIRVIGSTDGCFKLGGNATGRVYLKDCEAHYSTNTAGDTDGVQSLDVQLVVLERCIASHNDKDGFNFHTANAILPAAVLVDCKARENGTFITNTSCNGPTIHDGGALLDIRGTYKKNHGASCAHITASTVAAHIGTSATDDYGDEDRGGATGQAAGVGFAALTGATLYRYACTGNAVTDGGTLVTMSAS